MTKPTTRSDVHHQIKARCGLLEFYVGQPVRVRASINRRVRVVEVTRNQLGTTLYRVTDGGLFGSAELEAIK